VTAGVEGWPTSAREPHNHDDSVWEFGYVCRRSDGCTRDRQHQASPDCWCGPVQDGIGWRHR